MQALAAIHSKGFMHKDVKTDNFCMSKEHRTTSIYAIDYGFSRPAFGEEKCFLQAVMGCICCQCSAWQPLHTATPTCDRAGVHCSKILCVSVCLSSQSPASTDGNLR